MKDKFKTRAFSLIEIILAAVILGGFVHAALILSSQILTTRANGSFEMGRRNWAALEARLAVDGVIPSNVLSGMAAAPVTSITGSYNLDSQTPVLNETIQSGGSLEILPFSYTNNLQDGRNNCRTGMYLNAAAVPANPGASELGILFTLQDKYGNEIASIDSSEIDPDNIDPVYISCLDDIAWPSDGTAPELFAMAEQTAMGPGSDYQIKFGYGGSLANEIPEGNWHNVIINELLDQSGNSESPIYEITLNVMADSTGHYLDSPELKIPLVFQKITPSVEFTRTITDVNTVKLDDVIASINAAPTDNVMQELAAANITPNNLKTIIKGPGGDMDELPDYLSAKLSAINKIGNIELEDLDEEPLIVESAMELSHFNNQADYSRGIEIVSQSFLLQGIEASEDMGIETTNLPTVSFDPPSGTAVNATTPVALSLNRTGIFESIQSFEEEFYDLRYTTDGSDPNESSDPYEAAINVSSFFINGNATIHAQVFADKRNEIRKFITAQDKDSASYTMLTDDGVWRWTGGGKEGSSSWSGLNDQNSAYGNTRWDDPDKIPSGEISADNEYYQSGLDKTVLFGDQAVSTTDINFSGYPNNIPDPVLSHIVFNNDSGGTDYSYKIQANSTTITLDSSTERTSIEVDKGNHKLDIPIEVDRTVKITVAESASLEIAKNIQQTAETNNEGVIKLGLGDLNLGQNSSTDNLLDFLVQEGTLRINKNDNIESDSILTLDGGLFDLNNWDQNFNTGLDVTSVSYLDFGDSDSHQNDLFSKNLYIDSNSVLVIRNWQVDAQNNQSKNEFITEEYPGVRVLNRVQFEHEKNIGAKWRVTSGGGEIVPKTQSASTGLAYISVSEDSNIYFNDKDSEGCRLSIEALYILEGKTLTIWSWSNNQDSFYCLTQPEGEYNSNGTYILTGVKYGNGKSATWNPSTYKITRTNQTL